MAAIQSRDFLIKYQYLSIILPSIFHFYGNYEIYLVGVAAANWICLLLYESNVAGTCDFFGFLFFFETCSLNLISNRYWLEENKNKTSSTPTYPKTFTKMVIFNLNVTQIGFLTF